MLEPTALIPPRADFMPFDDADDLRAWIDNLPAEQRQLLLLYAFLPDYFPFGDC